MADLVAGLGVALVLEGLLWALAPDTARRMMQDLSSIDPQRLRPVAWGAVGLGCFLVWLVRG